MPTTSPPPGSNDQGDADALKTSSRYFRKTMFRTFAAILAFHIAIPLVLTDLLDPWRTFARTPVSAVSASVARFSASTTASWYSSSPRSAVRRS